MTIRTHGDGTDARVTPSTSRPRTAAWVAYATCACALVYAAMKLVYAAEGRLGLPGGPPVSDAAYARYDHVVLRQLGLVAVDLLAAGVALAAGHAWGGSIPRWLMLTALGVGFLALAAGATAVVQHTVGGSGPLRWSNLLLSAFVVAWTGLWLVTAWSYWRGPRAR